MNLRFPSVESVSPKRYATEVPANTSVRAVFSTDLDSDYIRGSVFMATSTGVAVPVRTVYDSSKRTIIVTPLRPLLNGTTYQVTFLGDADLKDNEKRGIRTPLGDAMRGNFIATFSTEHDHALPIPTPAFPSANSIIDEKPVFRWTGGADGNLGYHLELSDSNTFAALLYPVSAHRPIVEETLNVDVPLEDGLYYWRVRSVQDGAVSEWSDAMQFHLSTLVEGTVSAEDAEPIEEDFAYYDELPVELEIVETFPAELELLVKPNVQNLYFRVIGDVDTNKLKADSIRLKGQHIDPDFEEDSHGNVSGKVSVVKVHDGTCYLIFAPREMVGES